QEFAESPATRSVSLDELRGLIEQGEGAAGELARSPTTAVSDPDEDLLAESRGAAPATKVEKGLRGRPGQTDDDDYEIEISSSQTQAQTEPQAPVPVCKALAQIKPKVVARPNPTALGKTKPVPIPPADLSLDVDLGDERVPIRALADPTLPSSER